MASSYTSPDPHRTVGGGHASDCNYSNNTTPTNLMQNNPALALHLQAQQICKTAIGRMASSYTSPDPHRTVGGGHASDCNYSNNTTPTNLMQNNPALALHLQAQQICKTAIGRMASSYTSPDPLRTVGGGHASDCNHPNNAAATNITQNRQLYMR